MLKDFEHLIDEEYEQQQGEVLIEQKISGKEMLELEFEEVGLDGGFGHETIWTPQAGGEYIIGEYLAVKNNTGAYNQNVYVLRDSNEEIRSVFGSTVLDNKLKECSIGDIIKIRYNGKKQGQTRTYKDFSVSIGRKYE